MCNAVGDYLWTSHQGYISFVKKWDWLHKRSLLDRFSKEHNKTKRQYQRFVQSEDSAEITDFLEKNLASFFGSRDFVEWVEDTYCQLQNHKEIPQSRDLVPTVTEIKLAVCQFYEIEEKELVQTKRGWINEPRNVAVYLVRRRCGLRLEEIGQEFGIGKYSTVSSIVTRTEKQLIQNKQLRKRIDEICLKLNKSQAKT